MNFADIDKLLGTRRVPLAVCMPEETDTVMAAYEASNMGFVECIFVGNQEIIKGYIDQVAPGFKPEHSCRDSEAAFKSVELVRTNRASA